MPLSPITFEPEDEGPQQTGPGESDSLPVLVDVAPAGEGVTDVTTVDSHGP